MKCKACSDEYPKPDMVDGTAYFVCMNCGDLQEVANYHARTQDQIIEMVKDAFCGVELGNGIGLLQAQAIDNREPDEVQTKWRKKDEKFHWESISHELLEGCHSSLSFFDAEGMKFHLPAFIVASITGEVGDPLFHLTFDLGRHFHSKFATLSEGQKRAVSEYLTWCLTRDEYSYDYGAIQKALELHWKRPS
ncbi:DUF6714 family protein [Marinobacter sp. DUT-3]|uniref:DUF6714 family protein n=1 Tax=Marinobacter sp. DUT-3 TaxID=3412036 RepID=UPI003D17AA80